ncbi:MAG: phage tail protein [Sphingobium sp.]
MATMILTAVGTVLGGPIGAAIGATLGQVVDSQLLFRPKGREGARLSDLRLQTSRYGDQIPQLFGAIRVAGSVIWATDLIERRHKQGGGKGQPSVTTYSYSASFAVALSARRILAVRRIWADGNLLRGAAGDFKTSLGAFRLHDGSGDQPVDPLIAAHKGGSVTPAHRGIAYAVFEDLQLADYGNRIPSLTFEVVADDGDVLLSDIAHELSGGAVEVGMAGDVPAIGGYAASGAGIADALSPLVEGLDVAVEDSGGTLRLTRRTEGDGLIGKAMVGASFNGKAEQGVTISRGRAEEVPVRLMARHYDPARDYQAGAQTAERPGAGREEANLDLPATLEAAAARALAENRLQRLWVGRNAMELRCDWRALTCDPGRIVSVEGQAGRWRIDRSEWEAMGVRLGLSRIGGAGVADAPASSGETVAQVDALHGQTSLIVAELPVPGEEIPTVPVVVVAAAGAQAGWRSAELFIEDGQTGGLTSLGPTAPSATMGRVAVLPEAGMAAALFDMRSTVEVELLNDVMLLGGVSDAALLAGANRALLGREIIQFGEAEQVGPARWRLARLLRGRRATEWAMAAHEIGERFLLLGEDSLVSLSSDHVQIGATVLIDAIGIGDLIPVQAREAVTGQAMLPLSPVHVSARFDGGGWHVDWVRRSRNGWRWNDGTDAPMGEELELYRIALLHAGTVIRTVETLSPGWVYGAAAMEADRLAGISGPVTIEIRQVGTHGAGRPATIEVTV